MEDEPKSPRNRLSAQIKLLDNTTEKTKLIEQLDLYIEKNKMGCCSRLFSSKLQRKRLELAKELRLKVLSEEPKTSTEYYEFYMDILSKKQSGNSPLHDFSFCMDEEFLKMIKSPFSLDIKKPGTNSIQTTMISLSSSSESTS